MTKTLPLFLFGLLLVIGADAFGKDQEAFQKADSNTWKKVFSDPCTGDWKERWFLDGEIGTVKTSPNSADRWRALCERFRPPLAPTTRSGENLPKYQLKRGEEWTNHA